MPVAKGTAVKAPDKFLSAFSESSECMLVVKAQIHAGGRSKSTFLDGYKVGVKLAKSKDEALDIAHAMLRNTLVTHQTVSEGSKVQTVYFTEANDIEKEYYLSILLDRATSKHIIIAATESGVDIETVAEETPETIIKISIDPFLGLIPYQAR